MPCITQLTDNILVDCDKPLVRGVNPIYYLTHRDFITNKVFAADGVTLSSFGIKAGSAGLLKYEGIRYSTKPSVGFAEGDYGSTLPQTLEIALFTNGPVGKKQVHAMKGALDLVAFVKRLAGDWEAYGLQAGLRMSNFSQDVNDESTKGAYVITLLDDAATLLPYTVRHETAGVGDTDEFLETLVSA